MNKDREAALVEFAAANEQLKSPSPVRKYVFAASVAVVVAITAQ